MMEKFSTLDYVILIIRDLEESIQFYAEVLGLEMKHRAEEYAQFETGNTRLGLYTRDAMARTLGEPLRSPARDAPAFEIGFIVQDVDSLFEELISRGISPVSPPTDRPWGQRTAYIRDPDGHLIEFAQNLKNDNHD
jgi:lactoylglutathione lyase